MLSRVTREALDDWRSSRTKALWTAVALLRGSNRVVTEPVRKLADGIQRAGEALNSQLIEDQLDRLEATNRDAATSLMAARNEAAYKGRSALAAALKLAWPQPEVYWVTEVQWQDCWKDLRNKVHEVAGLLRDAEGHLSEAAMYHEALLQPGSKQLEMPDTRGNIVGPVTIDLVEQALEALARLEAMRRFAGDPRLQSYAEATVKARESVVAWIAYKNREAHANGRTTERVEQARAELDANLMALRLAREQLQIESLGSEDAARVIKLRTAETARLQGLLNGNGILSLIDALCDAETSVRHEDYAQGLTTVVERLQRTRSTLEEA